MPMATVRLVGAAKDLLCAAQETTEVAAGMSLAAALSKVLGPWQKEPSPPFLVVYNGHGVGRDEWESIELRDGDEIIILPLLSGG